MEQMLGGLEQIATRLESGSPVPALLLEAALEFLAACADGLPATAVERSTRRAGWRRAGAAPASNLARALREYVAILRPDPAREVSGEEQRPLLALGEALILACRGDSRANPSVPPSVRLVAVDVMRAVPRLAPDQSLASAASLMTSLRVRELPVVAGGCLVGLLAERDLRPHDGHYEWTTVETAMTRDPVTATAETPVEEIARLLLTRSFNALPVVVGGVPLGMVTRADLLRTIAGER